MKTTNVAMLLAGSAILIEVATPTPAAAGWCIEACGLVRVPKERTRETVCTTVRRGNRVETVCTSS